MKSYWESFNPGNKALLGLKTVITAVGLAVAKNFMRSQLHSGDIGIEMRLDVAHGARELNSDQRLMAVRVAREMFARLLLALGVEETKDEFVPGMIVYCEGDAGSFLGVLINLTDTWIQIRCINEETGMPFLRRLPLAQYAISEEIEAQGQPGLESLKRLIVMETIRDSAPIYSWMLEQIRDDEEELLANVVCNPNFEVAIRGIALGRLRSQEIIDKLTQQMFPPTMLRENVFYAIPLLSRTTDVPLLLSVIMDSVNPETIPIKEAAVRRLGELDRPVELAKVTTSQSMNTGIRLKAIEALDPRHQAELLQITETASYGCWSDSFDVQEAALAKATDVAGLTALFSRIRNRGGRLESRPMRNLVARLRELGSPVTTEE